MFLISNIMGRRNLLYILSFSFLKAHQYKSVEFFDTVIVSTPRTHLFKINSRCLHFCMQRYIKKSTTLIAFWKSVINSEWDSLPKPLHSFFREGLSLPKPKGSAAPDPKFYKQPRPVSTLLKGLIRWHNSIHHNPKGYVKNRMFNS